MRNISFVELEETLLFRAVKERRCPMPTEKYVETVGATAIEKVLELDSKRLHGIESLEKFTKCFHEEDDVYRCIYREEWRTKKEKMLVDEIERSGIFRKSEVLKAQGVELKTFTELQQLLSKRREEFKNALIVCLNSKADKAAAIQRVVRRFIRKLKFKPIEEHFETVRKKNTVKRIQKWWRWRRNAHKWRMHWVDMGGHAAMEKLEELHARNMHLLAGEGLSNDTLDDPKLRRRYHLEVLRDIVIMQSCARRWFAYRQVKWMKALIQTKKRNRRRNAWQQLKGGNTLPDRREYRQKHEELITWFVNVKNETARVDHEIAMEQKRVGKAFQKWDEKMTTIVLSRPLGRDWLPQVDSKSGETSSYLNLKTGKQQPEHPHMRYIKTYRKREFSKAQGLLNQRVGNLTKYKTNLLDSERVHRSKIFDEMQGIINRKAPIIPVVDFFHGTSVGRKK